jgi:uncharacterized membrane protein YeaQ/YmgE (transglycosylase-associated protein family)
MNWIDLLLTLAVAVIFATLAHLTSRFSRGGWFVHLGVGFLGALAGVIVSRSLPVPEVYILKIKTISFPIIWAIIGSVFFLAALGFFVKTERR